jgi:peptidoglycan/xylan/chitin deacetylase (PgdA/CDA1 family)
MQNLRSRLTGLLPGLLLIVAAEAAAEGEPRFEWPDGARAAISLAYDDALDSHLDNAIPSLDRHGLRASFYLTLASPVVRNRLDEWRAAAARGHELGNHSLFHPCSASKPGREWVTPWNDLDTMPVESMKQQVLVANTTLFAIDGREERTFTAPCGDLEAAGEPYIDAIKGEFVAIKSKPGAVTPDMAAVDPYAVGVGGPVGVTGAELIAVVRAAAEAGTMANLTFHGIGGDYLEVSVEAHDQLLEHLAANPDVYWVDTFLNIMKYVQERQWKE